MTKYQWKATLYVPCCCNYSVETHESMGFDTIEEALAYKNDHIVILKSTFDEIDHGHVVLYHWDEKTSETILLEAW